MHSFLKKTIQAFLHLYGYEIRRIPPSSSIERSQQSFPQLRDEFQDIYLAGLCLQKLLDDFDFSTVLDIGSGSGQHSAVFERYNKKVTQIDMGRSWHYQKSSGAREIILGNYVEYDFEKTFDAIWVSHVLEHQPNAGIFLRKIHSDLTEGGILAITVPPLKHEIVGGHVNLWNAGILLYNLILVGFDCRKAHVLSYGYNISVILKKKSVTLPDNLSWDKGDIDKLKQYFPPGCQEGFDGNLRELEWEGDDRAKLQSNTFTERGRNVLISI